MSEAEKLAQFELDSELSRIYDYVTDVFIKQERVLKFDEIYGDGTIWKLLSKTGAKEFYNILLESWQEWKTDNCSICQGKGCKACDLEIDEFLTK